MARIALVRAAVIRPIERFLRQNGAPIERLLERVHLDPDAIRDPEALVPAYLGTAFVSEAARLEGIEHLGALVALETHVHEFGAYGRKLGRSASLYELLATLRRFHAGHHSGETFWLDGRPDRPALCQRFTVHLDDWRLQSSQYSILVAAGLLISIAGGAWRPKVYLRTGLPRSLAETGWAERAEILFDQPQCAVEVDFSLLPLLVPSADHASSDADDLVGWYDTRPAEDLVRSLRQWLGRTTSNDAARIDVIAATIGTTPRTLQRRLAAAGTTYGRVLGEARFEKAARLLLRAELAICDVAYEVGYRDAAHLTRAFRRWSGMTPSAYRRMRQGSARTAATETSASRDGANWQPSF